MADVKKRRTKLGCLMCPPPPRGAPRCPPRWADNHLVDVREIAGLSTPWQFDAAGPEVRGAAHARAAAAHHPETGPANAQEPLPSAACPLPRTRIRYARAHR